MPGTSTTRSHCWPSQWVSGLASSSPVAQAWRNAIRFLWPLSLAALLWARSPLKVMTAKQWLVLSLVGFWTARIVVGYVLRGGLRRDDWRYSDLRDMLGRRMFYFLSLPMIFLGQSVFIWLAALPMYRVMRVGTVQLPTQAFAGVALLLFGILLETWADELLDKHKTVLKVVDVGPFAWSRHPNYFGEVCVWFGFWLVAGAEVGPSLAGPVAMAVYIVVVNVPLMEEHLRESRGQSYVEYCLSVPSSLVPLPPLLARMFLGAKPKVS